MTVDQALPFIKESPQPIPGMAYDQLIRETKRREPGGDVTTLKKCNRFFSFVLPLTDQSVESADSPSVQVAVCSMTVDQRTARWTPDDLYVPPGLWGTGIGTVFLRVICEMLRRDVDSCIVRH